MQAWSDERVEEIIGTLLRWGVILSAAVVAAGGAVYLWRHGAARPDFTAYHAEPEEYRVLGPMLRCALAGHGRCITQIGLILLIATPVARVAFAAVAFAWQKDRRYVAITLLVLGVLIYSLAGGV